MVLCLSGIAAAMAESDQSAVISGQEAGSGSFNEIGSIVQFGHYEQDNNKENGTEAIEWMVLDTDGNKSLLFSKYGLETVQYNNRYTRTTWETCSLRKWLNNEFLNTAFSEDEQQAILVTEVDNSESQGYSEWHAPGGNNTQDQVFLLSYAEANKYLNVTYENRDNIEARVIPTPYAMARGAFTSKGWKTVEGTDAGRWWLRSPGRVPTRAAHVYRAGSLADAHVTAFNKMFGGRAVARPAIWVDLGALGK